MNNFECGTSYNTEVYENDILASEQNFKIKQVELWGLCNQYMKQKKSFSNPIS